MSDSAVIRRGSRAQQILNDETVKEAFAETRARFIHQWENSEPANTKQRETAFANLTALRELENVLRLFVSRGETEGHKAQREEQAELAKSKPRRRLKDARN
jgi:hypothetical protein